MHLKNLLKRKKMLLQSPWNANTSNQSQTFKLSQVYMFKSYLDSLNTCYILISVNTTVKI